MADVPVVDLVGVGLNATDRVISVASYPVVGSKVEFSEARVFAGGQVATAVVACARWGLRARYVGRLGDDASAVLHREAFEEAGVDARLFPVAGCDSQQSVILVDGAGERTVLWRRDERLGLRPKDLRREWIVNARALHVDGYDTAAAVLAAGWAREAGVPVIADIDELYPGVEALLERVDDLIVSRDFPCRLMRERDLPRALERMRERFGCRLTAATLGEHGVLAWDGEQLLERPAYHVGVVDTTGAGDVFHAGFVYGLLAGWALERRLDFACAAAALNCTGMGARGGIGRVEAVEALMRDGQRYSTVAG